MKIYTKQGDKGKTSLFGGERVDKTNARIEANGTFDEVNSTIGLLRAKLEHEHNWQEGLHRIQNEIMQVMSHIASPGKNMMTTPIQQGIKSCEKWIDDICSKTKKMNSLILPGGNEVSALCHVARTQIRRAERKLIKLQQESTLPPELISYVNRLSDLFFMLAQYEMQQSDIPVEKFKYYNPKK